MCGRTLLTTKPGQELPEHPDRGNCVRSEAPMTRSTLFRRPEFPPIDGWAVADESSDEFRIAQIAELPQFLRRPRVLEQDLVNIKGIHLTTPEAVNR
jgi:hypothetical protein